MVREEPGVRLTELLAALSMVSDLGMGQPMEHNLRQCLIASRLADRIALDDRARHGVYYAGIMAWVGCHVDAYEQAKWFGDEMALKSDARKVDFATDRAGMAFTLGHVAAGQPLLHRARAGIGFIGGGMRDAEAMLDNHWRAVDSLAARLGLDDHIRTSIKQTFERWDGKGVPDGARGEEIVLTSRLVNLADVIDVFHQVGGIEAAIAVARERSGTQFDPQLVELFCDVAEDLFVGLEETPSWEAVMASEPALAEPLTDDEFDAALEAMADFADVKSPYTIGHSRGVADLAFVSACGLGLPAVDATAVRRAGLLHDLGRLGVPNSVWDMPCELTLTEMERVRMHPYLTERTLAPSPSLAPLGALAIQHHERLDGSGYPRGLRGDAINPSGGCSRLPMSTGRRQSRVRTAPLLAHPRRRTCCAWRCAPAASTATRWRRCCVPPATEVAAVVTRWPVSPLASWMCCGYWPGAVPTSRSPTSCTSPAKRWATTSSTSTPSSASPTGLWRACSPPSTV